VEKGDQADCGRTCDRTHVHPQSNGIVICGYMSRMRRGQFSPLMCGVASKVSCVSRIVDSITAAAFSNDVKSTYGIIHH